MNIPSKHAAEYYVATEGLTDILPQIQAIGDAIRQALSQGGTVYTCGNGGSSADAQHFTGELIGHYRCDRRPLRAITLGTDAVTASCISNDYDYSVIFSRQLDALTRPGDVVVAFTTSGRSENIVNAMRVAQQHDAMTILFSGLNEGSADQYADIVLRAPSTITPRIQEIHTFALHVISDMLDQWAVNTKEVV